MQSRLPAFDAVLGVKQLVYGRNSTNQIWALRRDGSGPTWIDNGAIGKPQVSPPYHLQELDNGAWAEGQMAFYCYNTQNYYLLYTRNVWTTPAYQIVYRKMSSVNGTKRFSDMALPGFGEANLGLEEKILLTSGRFTDTPFDPLGRNYGGSTIFALQTTPDCTCATPDQSFQYYLAFFAKADGGGRRTIFFKELTFDANGDIMRLNDNIPESAPNYDPRLDIHKFIVPVCRKGAPGRVVGDLNGDGRVNCSDAIAASPVWGHNSPDPLYRAELDSNLDGVLDASDKVQFDSVLDQASCPQGAPQCGPGWIGGAPPLSTSTAVEAVTTWDPDGSYPKPPQLVVAHKNTGGGFTVAMWDGAGAWQTLGFSTSGSVFALTAWDGKLVVGGSFTTISRFNGTSTVTVNASNIAQWDGTTLAWTPLSSGTSGPVRAFLPNPVTGNLAVGGGFQTAGGVSVGFLADWDGFEWWDVGGGTNAPVLALGDWYDSNSTPHLVVGGAFTSVSIVSGIPTAIGRGIAIWNGSSWSALGSGITNNINDSVSVSCLARLGSNIVAGGNFFNDISGTPSTKFIARWNGSQWTAMGSGLNSSVHALYSLGNGSLLAGGTFSASGTTSVNGVARWNGSAWQSLAGGVVGVNFDVTEITKLPSGEFVFGGEFGIAGGASAKNLARWSDTGAPWVAVHPPIGINPSNACGGTVTITTVPASGYEFAGELSYQWYRSGYPVSNGLHGASFTGGFVTGAQSPTLVISPYAGGDAGVYAVKVWNECNPSAPSTSTSCGVGIVCPADHNGSCVVEVADIFDFLRDWFATCIPDVNNQLPFGCLNSADYNQSGSVTVADIFAFLTGWFAGCH